MALWRELEGCKAIAAAVQRLEPGCRRAAALPAAAVAAADPLIPAGQLKGLIDRKSNGHGGFSVSEMLFSCQAQQS